MIESIFFDPWVWIVPIILSLALLLVVADIVWWNEWFGVVMGGAVLLVGLPVYFGDVLPPYDVSFYQTYRVTGQLASIESAFGGDEGTMSQVFVAEVEGVDLLIESDDQRFRTLTVGDDVNLVCGKEFRYFQEPWLDCAFGGR